MPISACRRLLYVFGLKRFGVDIAPDKLVNAAHTAFDEIQEQMQTVAPTVAKARGLTATDYRDVIRELKKEQLVGDAILPHYKARLAEIEAIIRREHLVTLPTRPARIRLATAAETAASPAPNMRPPRMLGNTGEQGEFLLPLNVPTTDGKTLKTDDFTFAAASWTLTAHEARPGHELQFAAMLEAGVSVARALFSFNSANVEGWGLYSELVMQPFLPPEGQLIALQHRLLRAARAYLDPELQAGQDHARSGARGAVEGRGAVGRHGAAGSGSLHFPGARPGHVILLRLHEARRDQGRISSERLARDSTCSSSTTSSSRRGCSRPG